MGFADLNDLSVFVQQPIDKNLLCSICHNIQETPTTICNNGHTYCNDCIAAWERQGHSECPECREPIRGKLLNRPLQSIILALRVKCPNKIQIQQKQQQQQPLQEPLLERQHKKSGSSTAPAVAKNGENQKKKRGDSDKNEDSDDDNSPVKKRARLISLINISSDDDEDDKDNTKLAVSTSWRHCAWEGTLSDYLYTHRRTGCPYRMVTCPACNLEFCISDSNRHHTQDCPRRQVPCHLCHSSVYVTSMVHHLANNCPMGEVVCRHCHKTMPRKNLGTCILEDQFKYECTGHMAVCPQLLVYCDFAPFGCKVGKLKRQDIGRHHAQAATSHVQLVAPSLRALQSGTHWASKSLQWNIPHTKFDQIQQAATGGPCVQSHEFRLLDYTCCLRFGQSTAQDGSTAMSVKIMCTKQGTVPHPPTAVDRPPMMDGIQITSVNGNHTCRLNRRFGEQTMDVDPSQRVYSVTGRLQLPLTQAQPGRAVSTFRNCTMNDIRSATDQDGVYSLEVQFRLKAPPKVTLGCV